MRACPPCRRARPLALPRTGLRRLCRKLHYWFGVAIAVPFFIIAASGCLLAFGHELDGLLSPDLYHPSGPERRVTAQQVLDIARRDSPLPILSLQAPNSTDSVWIVAQGDGKGPAMGIQQETFIDPASGQIIGRRATDTGFIRLLHRFHNALLLGDGGRQCMGVLGLLMAGMIVTGVIVWLPPAQGFRRSFLPRRGTKGIRLLLDWHTAASAWPLLLIILMTTTGITMEFPLATRAILGLPSGAMAHAMGGPVLPPDSPYPVSADQALDLARQALPGSEVVGLAPAGLNQPHWRVWLRPDHGLWRGRRQVMVDAKSGAIHAPGVGLAAFYVAQQHGLHGGSSFGLGGRIAIFAAGLLQAFLAISGLLVWTRRQRRRPPARVAPSAIPQES